MSEARPDSVSATQFINAIVAPFLVMSAYLWFSRWPMRWFTTTSDYAGLGAAIVVFGVTILKLPVKRKTKVMVLVGSCPLLVGALILFSSIFVGVAFGDWL